MDTLDLANRLYMLPGEAARKDVVIKMPDGKYIRVANVTFDGSKDITIIEASTALYDMLEDDESWEGSWE